MIGINYWSIQLYELPDLKIAFFFLTRKCIQLSAHITHKQNFKDKYVQDYTKVVVNIEKLFSTCQKCIFGICTDL